MKADVFLRSRFNLLHYLQKTLTILRTFSGKNLFTKTFLRICYAYFSETCQLLFIPTATVEM